MITATAEATEEAIAAPPAFVAGGGPSVSARNIDLVAVHAEFVRDRMAVSLEHLRDGYVHRVRRELYGARASINRMLRAVNTRGTM